jgi:hypothetical protein
LLRALRTLPMPLAFTEYDFAVFLPLLQETISSTMNCFIGYTEEAQLMLQLTIGEMQLGTRPHSGFVDSLLGYFETFYDHWNALI